MIKLRNESRALLTFSLNEPRSEENTCKNGQQNNSTAEISDFPLVGDGYRENKLMDSVRQ